MRSRSYVTLLVAVGVALAAPYAAAQASTDSWQFSAAPYLWASGMDGKMKIGDLEQDFDISFGNIIENLDIAFMGHFDMRNERWVLASDLIFVDLSSDQDLENGTATGGIDMTLFEVVGGYRVSPAVALLAGGRWVDVGASLGYSGEIVDEGDSASKSWIDPLVGVHVFKPLSDRWWIGVRGDIGGFGVGSELAWQAYADIGWKASDLVSIVLGYHALDIDSENDDRGAPLELDLMISGPQLGVVFSF